MKKITTNTDLFTALNQELSVILAKTEGCSVCGAIKQRLEMIEDNYKNIDFFEVYIEDFPEFKGQHLVFTVPTVLVMNNGKEILRESRFVNIRKIKNLLDNFLN